MIYKKKKTFTLGELSLKGSGLELSRVMSKTHNIVRRSVFGGLALIMVITNMVFLTYFLPERASAAVSEIVPNGDVTAGWAVLGGTNDATCAAGTHCDYVDEGSTPNTADYVGTGTAGTGGEVEEFSMTTVSNVLSATSITVYFYIQTVTLGSTADTVGITVRINGTLQAVTTVTPALGSWGWHSATFTGTWNQADIDSLQAYAIRNVIGSGPGGSRDDDIRLASVYASVTYTPSIQWEQSAYQWFENQDIPTSTWAQTWGGSNSDSAQAVVHTTDGGYVVAGTTSSTGLTAGGNDQALVKYNSSGVEQWSKTWGGTTSDQAYALVETSDGGFAVAGSTVSYSVSVGLEDQTLVKYNSSGVEQWSKTWGGDGEDIAYALIQTSDGGYAVAGYTDSTGLTAGFTDQTLVKYNSSGVEQWSKTWGGDGFDYATALVQTSDGGYAVAGYTDSTGLTAGFTDQTLVKYNSSGVEQWSKTWGGDGSDIANALIQTSDGGFAVAGSTSSTGLTAGGADQTLVKYNSSGVEQWSKTWGGTGNDVANALIQTSDGGFAVAGSTSSTGLTAGGADQTLVKYDSSGIEQWSKTWGGTGNDVARALIQTSDGGYAVAGSTFSTGLTAGADDQTFLKFASDGSIADCPACVDRAVTEVDRSTTEVDRVTTEVDRVTAEVDHAVTEVNRDSPQTLVHCGVVGGFFHTWGGTGSDRATAIALDSSGNIYTAGSTASTGLTAGLDDQTLVKYNSSGVEQWSKTWGGTGSDRATAIALDSSGNIYTAGFTASTGLTAGLEDQTLVKYDSSGVEQWSKTWGGDSTDIATAIALDSSGNIYTAGQTFSTGFSSGSWDQTLVKYDSSGVEQWSKTWGGTGFDIATAIALDSSDNIYVVGYTDSTGFTTGFNDQTLVKYNSSGVEQWSKTWGASSGNDYATSIGLDDSGNIFVAGYTNSTGLTAGNDDQTLVKYNSSGVEQWSKTWGGDGIDQARSLIIDIVGNIYVAGQTTTTGFSAGSIDKTLVKYNSSGVEQWSKTWGGSGEDIASALTIDSSGNIYVAGQANSSGLTSGGYDQTLIKIDASGKSCSGICTDRTTSEVDRTTSEVDRTTSEVDRTTSEVDRTTSEVDRVVTEVVRNETLVVENGINVGARLNGVSQNTATTAPAEGIPFRLRANLHVSNGDATASDFKLQYAERVGTCDVSFTGETYADVTSSSTIAYYTGNNAADGAPLASNVNDPTHGSDNVILQEYSIDGNFSVVNTIPQNNDGLWDFALVDNGAPAYTSYCFRIVDSSGGVLTTYTVVPEIIISDPSFEQSSYRWFENQDADTSTGTWAQSWGGDSGDEARALIQTSDGGFVVAGYTFSTGLTAGGVDQTLVKYDASGIEQWSKTWGGDGNDLGHALIQTSDGGFAVAGYTNSTGLTAGLNDQTLVKYNSSGVEQWSKTWGGDGNDAAWDLIQTSDGGFAVAGETRSTGLTAGNVDQTLVKYDASGIEQWSKTWGGTGDDIAWELVQTSDDGFVVAGTTSSTGLTAGSNDQTLVKYNSSGVEQWSKTWGGTGDDRAYALIQTSDGGFAVAGTTASTGLTAGSFDQTLVKYDASGIEQWSKTWGGTGIDVARSLIQTSDGGFAVAGQTDSTGLTAGGNDQTLVKYNSSGVEQWSKTWGGDLSDYAYDLIQTSDGGFAVAGQTASTGLTAGSNDQTLLKFASDGSIADCALCVDRAVAEVDRAVTEVDRATAEVDRATAEVDRAVTEVNRDSPQTLVHCGVVGGFFHTWGGDGGDQVRDITLDTAGNIYVIGYNGSTGLTAGGSDQTLVKYNSSGVEQWSKTWGGTGSDLARALALDTAGNIYVAGYTSSTGLTSGGIDQTLVKYDSNGVEQWSKTWGGAGSDLAIALALDTAGNIYVAGETDSTGLTAGLLDQTLVKYDSSGIEQWSKTWGGTGNDQATDIALDAAGNIYVVGETTSTGLTAGGDDQTLVKYNSSGVEQWSKTWGGTGNDYATGLTLDTAGNIFVVGYTASTGLTSGGDDQTLVKYDSSGVEQWSKTWGGDGSDQAFDIALDTVGNIYVAGRTASTGLTVGLSDQNLVKYNSSGVEQWSKTWGGTGNDYARNLALDTAGNIYVAGTTDSTGLTAGNFDQTLIKIDSNGTCSGVCTDRTMTEVDRATSEVDRATSEVDRTMTEVDRATSEVDRAVAEVVRNETLLPNPNAGVQLNDTWAQTWGGDGADIVYALVQTSDGGFATAGYTASTGLTAGGADQTLVKYDASGIEQWSKTWGGTGDDRAEALVQTSDGGYAVAGYTASTGLTAGSYDQTLVKYDSLGIEQWSKTWGGTGDDRAYALIQTSDGGFAVAGYTASTGLTAGGVDQTLVKYNSSGIEQWTKTWGGTGSDVANALIQTSDGGYAVAGYTASTGLTAGLDDQTLVKYDSSGIEQWSKTWGGDSTDRAETLVQTSDGGFAVAGYTNSTGLTAGDNDQTLVKYDSSGIEQWSKTWGGTGSDIANALVQTSDGGYAVAGYTASTGLTAGGVDQTLVKYDASGIEQWSKTWGGTSSDAAYTLIQTTDGGYAVAGSTISTGLTAGGVDQTLIKFDSNGDIADCALCVDRDVTEVDRAVTEVDRATTEVDRATAEVDRAVTEVNRDSPQTLVHCGTVGGFFHTWGGTGNDLATALIETSDGGYAVAWLRQQHRPHRWPC
jgi:uncharacterized delta-60 repeat protein